MIIDRINCAQLAAFVTDYLEDALPRRRRRAFERHLARCTDCDTYFDQMRQTIALAGRLDESSVTAIPEDTRQKLWEAFVNGSPPDDDASGI